MIVGCLGLILGGCNEDSEPAADQPNKRQEEVARVASAYLEAFGSGDFKAACRLTAPVDIEDVFRGRAKVCARRLTKSFPLDGGVVQRLSGESIDGVKIERRDAVVDLASGGYLRLIEQGGTWYVRFS